MKKYFLLQAKLLNRRIIDFGLPLIIGYLLILFAFIFFSNYLFDKTTFASYIYVAISITFILKLNEEKRNDFLKTIFNNKNYKRIRVIENIVYAIPFTLFLIYKSQFLFSILLNLMAVVLSLLSFKSNIAMTIPTPFGKKPFEFTVGFRKTFYAFPVAYFLTYIAITVSNFNLGLFSILLIGVICLSYYTKMENDYFVWNFNLSSKQFLFEKVRTSAIYFTFLILPIVIALSVSFFNKIDIIIIFICLCYMYLVTMIFAKYSSFPDEINATQVILIVLSFMFPPLLLVVTPHFYKRSIKLLNAILE